MKQILVFLALFAFLIPKHSGADAFYNIGMYWMNNNPYQLIFNPSTIPNQNTWACNSMTVQRLDQIGRLSTVGTTTVNLTGASVFYFTDSACSFTTTTMNINNGQSSTATFYYSFSTNGTLSINASSGALISATASATVVTTDPYTWIGGVTCIPAFWATGACWKGGAAPGVGNKALFDATCTSNCSPSIMAAIDVGGIALENNYAGTVTASAAVTIESSGFLQAGGTFTMGANTFIDKSFFYDTSGPFTNTGAGAQTHFTGPAGNYIIYLTGGTNTFTDVYFDGTSANYTTTGTMTINGNLLVEDTTAGTLTQGTLNVTTGNVTAANTGETGSTVVQVSGAGAQSVTGAIGVCLPSLTLTSSGTVNMSTNLCVSGNYVNSASGTVNVPATTMELKGSGSCGGGCTITPGTQNYLNVTVDGNGARYTLNNTMNVTGTLLLKDSSGGSRINAGTAPGEFNCTGSTITADLTGYSGSAIVLVDGTVAQTIKSNIANALFPNLTINAPTGNVTLNGTIYLGRGYVYTSAGTFSTNALYFAGSGGGGTVTGGSAAAVTYPAVTFNGNSSAYTLTDTLTVTGTLTLSDSGGGGTINGGTLEAQGNITVSSSGYGGTAAVTIDGAGGQTLANTSGSGTPVPTGAWLINKSAGTLTFNNNLTINKTSAALTMQAGTVNLNSKTLTIGTANTATFTMTGGTWNDNQGTLKVGTGVTTTMFTQSGGIFNLNGGAGLGTVTLGNLTFGQLNVNAAGTFNCNTGCPTAFPACSGNINCSTIQGTGTINH